MNGEFTVSLRHAMQYDTPDRRIDSLKNTVSNFLRAGDPTARVRQTEYFNHTFAPDLVLSWPQEKRERLVFLRTNPDPEWLAEDLRVIAQSHPIMLTLDVSDRDDHRRPETRLLAAAKEARTLVTDPAAIEEFTSPQTPITSVLTNALMRGGVGVVDEQAARNVTESAITGFTGAANLEPGPIRSALLNAEEILDDEQARRFSRLYQAVWEGQGGAVENFPWTRNLAGPLTSRDLLLLLSTLSTDDPQFWRRIGRSITLGQITAIGGFTGSSTLDRLVEANLDRLAARGGRVFGRSDSASSDRPAHWSVEGNCLVLRGAEWRACFAPRATDLPPHEHRRGVSVDSLASGVRDLGVRMTEVKVQQADFAISIEAVGIADVIDSPNFDQLSMRSDSIVNSAAIAMPSGRNLIADFNTGTATGHTNATFTLDELGPAAIHLLLQLSQQETADLSARLVPESDPEVIQFPLWE